MFAVNVDAPHPTHVSPPLMHLAIVFISKTIYNVQYVSNRKVCFDVIAVLILNAFESNIKKHATLAEFSCGRCFFGRIGN